MVRHALAIAILLTLSPAWLRADVTAADSPIRVYLEPFASDNGGEVAFLNDVASDARLGDGQTLLFDDLNLWPQGELVNSVVADGVELSISGNTSHGAPFVFHPDTFFCWEGQVFGGTLVMGPVSQLTPTSSGEPMGAVGFWIFDDGNLRDSVYQVDVLDTCGNTATAIVENAVPRVAGYEVEGFVGVVSDRGIVQVTVTALNATTYEAWNDPFEIDYLNVVRLADPQSCVPQTPDDDDGGSDCSCDHHKNKGRGHAYGHCRGRGHHSRHGRGNGHHADNDG